jgi:hypothetical protein
MLVKSMVVFYMSSFLLIFLVTSSTNSCCMCFGAEVILLGGLECCSELSMSSVLSMVYATLRIPSCLEGWSSVNC